MMQVFSRFQVPSPFSVFTLLAIYILPAVCAARTKALIPLYVDLEKNANAWDPLYSAVQSHPNIDFTVIVNPGDGPGPNANPGGQKFVKATEKLKSYRNVQIIGYVKIGYGKRSMNSVTGEINRYAGWRKGNGKIAVDGIFLDEATEIWNATSERYLQDVQRLIKGNSNLGARHITINPGTPPNDKFFTIADTVCVVENKYSYWKSKDCQDRLSKVTAPRDRRCIIVHSATGLNRDGYRNLTRSLESKAGYLFVTDLSKNYYEGWGKSYPPTEFAKDLSS
ncbi:hypothetical protein EJ08DRAFT_463660 [Tothia fuscella]|uniref:Spherulin-4 n=1 Tax=Tothia fuscella TaxID=1048955 RepID=A0A9P4NIS7_9PEZI|nr:hypothetical protein EJ08DRAFT_463660 [Tothia fuscella]